MKTTVTFEVPAYAQLQHEIHDALRAQHPEWILPNGDSPTLDTYDARFAELLTNYWMQRHAAQRQVKGVLRNGLLKYMRRRRLSV